VFFKTSHGGGGWSGKGQLIGHLICTPLTEERLEAFILLQALRESPPSTEAIINEFAAVSARRLDLII
jgi:hypothetical protein